MIPRRTVAIGVASFGLLCSEAAFATATHATESAGGAFGARWKTDVIQLTVEPSYERLGEGAVAALVHAVAAWQEGADLPTVVVKKGATASLGYDPLKPNFNTVRFAPSGDPLANGALAITVITFDTTQGRVLDADIIVNGEHHFDLLDDNDEFAAHNAIYDLQNVLTHEFGHLLGLGEEYDDESATMYAYSLPGETHKRKLTHLDGDKVASLYDPSTESNRDPNADIVAQLLDHAAHGSLWALFALGATAAAWAVRRRPFRLATAFAFAGAASVAIPLASVQVPEAVAALDAAKGYLMQGIATVRNAKGVRELAASAVVDSRSHWDGGLIVTHLRLEPLRDEPRSPRMVTVLGGQVGAIRQVVGNALPPPVGSKVRVSAAALDDADSWRAMGTDGEPLTLEAVHSTTPR